MYLPTHRSAGGPPCDRVGCFGCWRTCWPRPTDGCDQHTGKGPKHPNSLRLASRNLRVSDRGKHLPIGGGASGMDVSPMHLARVHGRDARATLLASRARAGRCRQSADEHSGGGQHTAFLRVSRRCRCPAEMAQIRPFTAQEIAGDKPSKAFALSRNWDAIVPQTGHSGLPASRQI
jgi:hypothetical protein